MKQIAKMIVVSFSSLILVSCAPIAPKDFAQERTSQNNESSVGKSMQNNQDNTQSNQSSDPLELNTGKQLVIGGTATVFVPFFSGSCNYEGTVTNMYPESGEVWIRSKGGIMSFTYRYVVDVQVSTRTCQDDQMTEPETVDYSSHIRSVVTLSKQDDPSYAVEEELLVIRDLDGANTFYSHYKIVESTEYRPFKWFSESEMNNEMLAFYQETQKVAGI